MSNLFYSGFLTFSRQSVRGGLKEMEKAVQPLKKPAGKIGK